MEDRGKRMRDRERKEACGGMWSESFGCSDAKRKRWSDQRQREGKREEREEGRNEGRKEDTFLGIGSPHLVPIATQPSMKY